MDRNENGNETDKLKVPCGNEEKKSPSPQVDKNEKETKTVHEAAVHHDYMQKALEVARAALLVGEVPVGCVIVLEKDHGDSVIVSHGANQVNATRDATRHGELVAIDRMLTGGMSSDRLSLPLDVIRKSAHGTIPTDCLQVLSNNAQQEDRLWNVPEDKNHWKNSHGWGSGRMYNPEIFSKCDLYVTCEPCIMCAAALARVGIGRVFFGCRNDRFGGCGSLLHLHQPTAAHKGYPIIGGMLADEAIALLRSFYNRENFHAPDEKRRRKDKAAVKEKDGC